MTDATKKEKLKKIFTKKNKLEGTLNYYRQWVGIILIGINILNLMEVLK
jgi:hypothetical protein